MPDVGKNRAGMNATLAPSLQHFEHFINPREFLTRLSLILAPFDFGGVDL